MILPTQKAIDSLSFNTSSSREKGDSVACAKTHKVLNFVLVKGLLFSYEEKSVCSY